MIWGLVVTTLASVVGDHPFHKAFYTTLPGRSNTTRPPSLRVPCPKIPGTTTCAPTVVIAGSKKCGTNTIGALLESHPTVRFAGQSRAGKRLIQAAGGKPFGENWFLECELYDPGDWPRAVYGCDRNGSEGWANMSAYAVMFELGGGRIGRAHVVGFDRSPLANVGPFAGARLRQVAPHARVVVITCDPVRRAWSAIEHMLKTYAKVHDLIPPARTSPTVEDAAVIREQSRQLTLGTEWVLQRVGHSFEALLRCAESRHPESRQKFGHFNAGAICREILLPGLHFAGIDGFVRAGFE